VPLSEIHIYRITHIENIPHILRYGITHRNSPNRNQDFRNIGDISLIDVRGHRVVNVDNGDINFDPIHHITLGDYIPFYFGVRMPMLYVAQIGGNFVQTPTPPEDIIYLKCPLCQVISDGRVFYFTDGHATDMLTTFYDQSKISELAEIIDWAAVIDPYWGGNENLDLKRKKQAEFLVSGDIAPDHISGFACYNEQAKNRLVEMGISQDKIRVYPRAYY
jgi:hypothetical protein